MSINSPKISCIMCVYNTKESFLKEAIDSILNQTFSDFELIIINDGSTENNVEDVVKSYTDSRIRYILKENQGNVAFARNLGNSEAKGEFIAIMDSDDIALSTRFEKQVAYLDQHPEIGILGAWLEVFPKKNILDFPEFPKYLDFYKGCCVGHSSIMFRKELFQKNDLKYDPAYKCEDYELWSRAIRFVKFANLQEVLIKYRVHEQNISKPTPAYLSNVQRVQQNMLDFLTDDSNLQSKIKDAIPKKQGVQIRFFIPRFIGNILGMFMSRKKRKEFKAKYVKAKKH